LLLSAGLLALLDDSGHRPAARWSEPAHHGRLLVSAFASAARVQPCRPASSWGPGRSGGCGRMSHSSTWPPRPAVATAVSTTPCSACCSAPSSAISCWMASRRACGHLADGEGAAVGDGRAPCVCATVALDLAPGSPPYGHTVTACHAAAARRPSPARMRGGAVSIDLTQGEPQRSWHRCPAVPPCWPAPCLKNLEYLALVVAGGQVVVSPRPSAASGRPPMITLRDAPLLWLRVRWHWQRGSSPAAGWRVPIRAWISAYWRGRRPPPAGNSPRASAGRKPEIAP
jgi:hypothetical protein